jgi:orotate phosphoribosyltransferase
LKMSKEEWAAKIIVPLYREQFIQTLWNAEEIKNREKGWKLKNKSWSPWFFNMRPFGDSPLLFNQVMQAMAELISPHEVDFLIGVEMAGIAPVGGLSVASYLINGREQRIGYTRPLPKKVRDPREAMELLNNISAQPEEYGQKSYIEGRFRPGDRGGILDDMATDLGSKIIARQIVLWEAAQRKINITCNKIFYFLNRTKGNREKGIKFANETEPGLHPAVLDVNYVLEFDDHFPKLRDVMKPEEYELVDSYQKDPKHFQDEDVQKEVLAMAKAN